MLDNLTESILPHPPFAHESIITPDTVSDHTCMAMRRLILLAFLQSYRAKLMSEAVTFNLERANAYPRLLMLYSVWKRCHAANEILDSALVLGLICSQYSSDRIVVLVL